MAPLLPTFLNIGIFSYIPIVFLVFLSFCIGILLRINKNINYGIVDVLILFFILYGAISLSFYSAFGIRFWEWSAIILVYIFVRLTTDQEKNILLVVLVLSGLIQSGIALGQIYGLIASNHPHFDVTGSFNNPGQLGGYLSVSLIISIGLLKRNKQPFHLFLFSSISVVMGGTLILTDSRAGLVAALCGLIVLFGERIFKYIKGYKRLSITGIAIVFILLFALLYSYRPESANGRLLIWLVSLGMIFDKPLFGHGVGSFNKEYMLYQAKYFEGNPDSSLIMVADNVGFPYNEFLHITIELGLAGLLFVVIILSVVLFSESKNYDQKNYKAGLVGLVVFSMFSYPSSIFSLFIILPIFLGGAVMHFNEINRCFISLKCITIPLLCCFSIVAIKELLFYRSIYEIQQNLKYRQDKQSFIFMENHLEKLMSDPLFNAQYSYFMLYKYKKEISDEIIYLINPSCDVYCDIGDIFYKKGNIESAKYYYGTASYMIPSRITPKYKLWRLHLENRNTEIAKEMANKIASQELKVQNTSAIRMKYEVRKWLNDFTNFPQ